jgi:hypothetical protein
MMSFERSLYNLWKTRVASRFMYRGMASRDLTFLFHPEQDKFIDVRAQLNLLLVLLEKVSDSGFTLHVIEEHWGRVYIHNLSDIIHWTRSDLCSGGIDFTSLHRNACEYADNCQGSQMKQNVRYITGNLKKHKTNAVLSAVLTKKDWRLVEELHDWVSDPSADHERIVLWVRRNSTVFGRISGILPLGPYREFRSRMIKDLNEQQLPLTIESAHQLLPCETKGFNFRLHSSLCPEHIEKIEKI